MLRLIGGYYLTKGTIKTVSNVMEPIIYFFVLAIIFIPLIPIVLVLLFFFGDNITDYLPEKHKYSMYKLRDKLNLYMSASLILYVITFIVVFTHPSTQSLNPINIIIIFTLINLLIIYFFLKKYYTALKKTKKISYALKCATEETINDLSYVLLNYYYHKDEASFQEDVKNIIKKFTIIFERHSSEDEYPLYKEYVKDNLEISKKIIDSEIRQGYKEEKFKKILSKKLLKYSKSMKKVLSKKYKGKIDDILIEYGVLTQ